MSVSPGRIVGIALGSVAILAIGVYGPAMLLGPLPEVTVRTASATSETPAPAAAVSLPADGQSALAVVDDEGSADVVATAGPAEPTPIGGAAKLVTLLVTLDSLPLQEGAPGPDIRIGPEDFTDYLRYSGEGSRVVPVSPGETWSERDVAQAVLLASSNNHADTLARWAFGSVDQYVTAANAWLAEQGFTATRVVDATGLSGDNVGTASELTDLAARVVADPNLGTMLANGDDAPVAAGGKRIADVIAHLEGDGIRALTRSFTDQGGLGFVFTTEVPGSADQPAYRLIGAILGQPDYETLDPAVLAAVESAKASANPVEVIVAGTAYGSVESAWGDRAELVAAATRTDASWGAAPGAASVDVDRFTTAADGRTVGTVTVAVGEREVSSALELEGEIRDPGPIWRLTNPATLITAFLERQD
jgi:D-alanyl-D-alanine carboxypeptidase (penicillin-binding protein 5/6)